MGKGAGQVEIELLIVPAASRWSTPRGVFGGGAGEQRARHFREQMGLPAGLIVMSGHQPGFWHAGIAAKALAAAALAERWGASAVWIIVDQDTVDPRTMRVPVIGEGGRLEESVWRLGGALDAGGPETPTCLRPAMNIGVHRPDPGLAERVAGPTATEGLELMAQGLADAVGSGNSAWELGRAGVDSLWRAAHATKADSHIRLVAATQVGATDLFTEVLERMRSDPAACTGAYNAAAAELNAPGIGPLASDAARAGGER